MKYKRKVKSFYLSEELMRVYTDDVEEWLNENNDYEIKSAQVHDIGYASGGKGQYITLILEKEGEVV